MTDAPIIQTTIWGADVSIEPRVESVRTLRIRPKFRPAPLFDALDGNCQLVGVPSHMRRAFGIAARKHASDHPKAKPLTYPAFLRAQSNPVSRRPAGRPTQKPDSVQDKNLWAGYLSAKRNAQKVSPLAPFPAFDAWVTASEPRRNSVRAGMAGQQRSIHQEVVWIVVVPRREMIKDPSIEREWHKRLHNDPMLAKTHRIRLRGVQRRVS